jgi:hypothetical protein
VGLRAIRVDGEIRAHVPGRPGLDYFTDNVEDAAGTAHAMWRQRRGLHLLPRETEMHVCDCQCCRRASVLHGPGRGRTGRPLAACGGAGMRSSCSSLATASARLAIELPEHQGGEPFTPCVQCAVQAPAIVLLCSAPARKWSWLTRGSR